MSVTTALMAGGAWWFNLREPPVVRIGPPLVSLGCQVGGRLPLLKAEGWLNGGPRRVRDQLGKIVVVDMWTDSCGVYCQATQQLRAIAAKYDDNPDVVFIGLTALAKQQAEQFTREAGIDWSSGYGVQALEGILPTIVVLDRDGRVVWEDRRTRLRHSVAALAHDLDAAIHQATEEQSVTPPSRPRA
jgi:hypothetical protein